MIATSVSIKKSSRRRSPFLAILIKELKQNIIWAMLGMLAFALILSFMILTYDGRYGSYDVYMYWTAALRATMPLAPIIGFALGLLQILPERRRDLWAFLMHRPASPLLIFTGKAVAGTILYFGALGIPLLIPALHASVPGHVPGPFNPGMTLVTIGAVMTGWPFYFAGLLVALRPSRWGIGQILVTIATGILFVLTMRNVFEEFRQVTEASILFAGFYAVAAYGSFVRTDDYERQPRGARFALGIVLYLSSLMAWAVFLNNTVSTEHQSVYVGADSAIEQFGAFSNGDVALLNHSMVNNTPIWICNASGVPKPLHDYKVGAYHIAQELWSGSHPVFPEYPYWMADRYALPLPSVDTTRYKEDWYVDVSAHQIVGYSVQTRRLIYVAGPNGFYPGSSRDRAGRFDTSLWFGTNSLDSGSFLVRHGQRLLRVSLSERTVQPLDIPVPIDTVRGSITLWSVYNDSSPDMVSSDWEFKDANARANAPASAVMATGRAFILSRSGKTLFSITREYSRRDYPSVSILASPPAGRIYVLYQHIHTGGFAPGMMSIWNAGGQHVATVPIPRMQFGSTLIEASNQDGLVAGPAISLLAGSLISKDNGHLQTILNALPMSFFARRLPPYYLTWCIAIGLSCAVCALLIARRWGLPWKSCAMWAFAGFWLGIPGAVTFLFLRDWPARLPCPTCRKPRVVTREICEHCAAPFPFPMRDGTEIFNDGQTPHTDTDAIKANFTTLTRN